MAQKPKKQAVFLELDGVITKEPRLTSDQHVRYYRGALESMARIDTDRFQLFIATNRTDLALGQLKEREFKRFCERFQQDLIDHNIKLSKFYSCPFHPKGKVKFRKESVFRKPAPGMYKIAQQEFDLNLARCWVVGHTTTDILAGLRGGLGTILVKTGEAGEDGAYRVEPHFEETDITAAITRINQFELAMRL